MDIERGCLDVLLKRIPYLYIRDDIYSSSKKDRNDYSNISKDIFGLYARDGFPQYTDDEVEYIYVFLKKKLRGDAGIFDFVAEVAGVFLTYNECEPQCQYEQVLRWRDCSFKLGQDLLTTAYLAKIDTDFNQNSEYFAWSPVIKTDNKRLHNILNQGMADNHFHLNGSTQIFALSWACLMNHIEGRQKEFKQIKFFLDSTKYLRTEEEKKTSLYNDCMVAALIRVYLFFLVKNEKSCDNVFELFDLDMKRIADFDVMSLKNLQLLINTCKEDYALRSEYGFLDYALEKGHADINHNDNRVLAGERKFLYDCQKSIFQGKFSEDQKNFFYIYLLIKNTLRGELIQVNDKIGFKNFSVYQDRKEIFIENYKQYEHEMVRLAINSTLKGQNIVSLEARFCPKSNGSDNKKFIKYYDRHSGNKRNPKHFYVLHFPKKSDTGKYSDYIPRNNILRNRVEKWTNSIVALLEMDGKSKYRIKGIDACSNEIGCRPEVFAQSFRYLTKININAKSVFGESCKPIKLYATYHVGEDFLDIADGMRAIDEVILFCNLTRGSRLGHALALGIDVASYYQQKNYKLIMNKQDVVDNIVWLIEKAKEYGININGALLSKLERTFEDLFYEIYDDCCIATISTYSFYNAWKLRGDKPDIYKIPDHDFKIYLNSQFILQSEYYEVNRLVHDSIRLNRMCKNLNYCYHFNKEVKRIGNEKFILKVDMLYVNLVRSVQKKMQFEIAQKGIAIESNPSSNYLIGTINRYDQHPIIKFNNLGLATDTNEINDSPLLSVSINTDDQGVFDTSLENEYALIAFALEKCIDENGDQKYKPENIYKWIDHIRKLGLEQVF